MSIAIMHSDFTVSDAYHLRQQGWPPQVLLSPAMLIVLHCKTHIVPCCGVHIPEQGAQEHQAQCSTTSVLTLNPQRLCETC